MTGTTPKTPPARYRGQTGRDFIDDFEDAHPPEEFRGAMRFNVGKYTRRAGKKGDVIEDIDKIIDYCERWKAFERGLVAPRPAGGDDGG